MNITLRQLRVFQAVAHHMSFTKAAVELHLTQPAVSIQIKQLEQNIGLALFEQIGKKIYLSQAGQELLHYSQRIAEQLHEAEQVFAELKGVDRGRLDIAVASTANYFASRLLAVFGKQYPQAAISLDVTNRQGLLQQLSDNAVDLVIMGKPPDAMELVSEPFMDNPLVIIAPPEHPLAQRTDVALSKVVEESFVIREPGSGTRAAMERFFQQHKIQIATSLEMTSNEAIKQAVSAGLGLGIVSLHTLELELLAKRLAVLHVAGFPIARRWYVVHRQGKRLSPIAREFRDFLLQKAAQIWPLGTHSGHESGIPTLPPTPRSRAGE